MAVAEDVARVFLRGLDELGRTLTDMRMALSTAIPPSESDAAGRIRDVRSESATSARAGATGFQTPSAADDLATRTDSRKKKKQQKKKRKNVFLATSSQPSPIMYIDSGPEDDEAVTRLVLVPGRLDLKG